MVNYPLGDALISIKNASRSGRREVALPSHKLVVAVIKVLEKGGFLTGVAKTGGKISAGYVYKKGHPKLMDLKLISKPGLRVYWNVDQVKAKRGSSRLILSTPKGILFDRDAIKQNVGGEVLVEVY